MKTILVLLIISASVQAQTYGYLEGGVGRRAHSIYSSTGSAWVGSEPIELYTAVNIAYKLSKFHLINTVETFMVYPGGKTFRPTSVEYIFNLVYIADKWEIGYKHSCTHPVFSNKDFYDKLIYRGSYDKLYVRLKFNY